MSNLIGKIFEDTSGNNVIVNNVDGMIAHLDNGQRIAIERLLDPTFYNEQIDPESFLKQDTSYLSSLDNQIKNIDLNRVGTIDQGVQITSNIPVVESHDANLRSISNGGEFDHAELEDRKREIAQNAANINNKISNNKLMEFVDEEDLEMKINRNLEGVSIEGRDTSVVMYNENNDEVPIQHNSQPQPQPDPIYKMFEQVKRSTNFSLNVKLIEKIPRKDFLKMWEDSYEISIIDYLVDEFTNKLLKDPTMIKDQLKEALMTHVYGKPKAKTKAKPKDKPKNNTKS